VDAFTGAGKPDPAPDIVQKLRQLASVLAVLLRFGASLAAAELAGFFEEGRSQLGIGGAPTWPPSPEYV
jgi:hypothetical protein